MSQFGERPMTSSCSLFWHMLIKDIKVSLITGEIQCTNKGHMGLLSHLVWIKILTQRLDSQGCMVGKSSASVCMEYVHDSYCLTIHLDCLWGMKQHTTRLCSPKSCRESLLNLRAWRMRHTLFRDREFCIVDPVSRTKYKTACLDDYCRRPSSDWLKRAILCSHPSCSGCC